MDHDESDTESSATFVGLDDVASVVTDLDRDDTIFATPVDPAAMFAAFTRHFPPGAAATAGNSISTTSTSTAEGSGADHVNVSVFTTQQAVDPRVGDAALERKQLERYRKAKQLKNKREKKRQKKRKEEARKLVAEVAAKVKEQNLKKDS